MKSIRFHFPKTRGAVLEKDARVKRLNPYLRARPYPTPFLEKLPAIVSMKA